MIIGLCMLGYNSLFAGFRTGDWQKLNEMLLTFVKKQGSDLQIEDFDLILWLGYLSEQGKLAPLQGDQKWFECLITKFAPC